MKLLCFEFGGRLAPCLYFSNWYTDTRA